MNFKNSCLFALSAFFFALVLGSCGNSDVEDVVDCYEEHVNQATITTYSEAIQAFSQDPTNTALCEAANEALNAYVSELVDYAKCAQDNDVELQAGFENIDEQIENLENSENDFDC